MKAETMKAEISRLSRRLIRLQFNLFKSSNRSKRLEPLEYF
jgi:hypothetical protein